MTENKNKDQWFPGAWSRYTDDPTFVQDVREDAARIRLRIAGAPLNLDKLRKESPNAYKKLIRERAVRRRFAKKIARRYIASQRGIAVLSTDEANLEFSYERNVLLDELVPERETKFETNVLRRKKKKYFEMVELEGMSFLTNPEKTIEKLGQVVDRDCDTLNLRVDFHDHYCDDIGPFLVLSSIWRDLQVNLPGGDISQPMSKVLNALEIDQELDIKVPIPDGTHQDVYPIQIMNRRRSGSSKSKTRLLDPQSFEKISKSLIENINKWLSVTAGQSLTKYGRRIVLKLATETLNNAERHGDIFAHEFDADWALAGFMARREVEGKDVFRCHLGFLSTGSTIEETIATAPEPTQSAMVNYTNRHKGTIGSRKLAEKHLRTIYALQDGVTRSKEATKEQRNGTGFQDILTFYSDLAGGPLAVDASLSVVSGRTCVICSGPYMHGTRMAGGDSERELWFNEQNDQSFAPDPNHVVELGRGLKGTLITMAFTLDPEYLERTVDREH